MSREVKGLMKKLPEQGNFSGNAKLIAQPAIDLVNRQREAYSIRNIFAINLLNEKREDDFISNMDKLKKLPDFQRRLGSLALTAMRIEPERNIHNLGCETHFSQDLINQTTDPKHVNTMRKWLSRTPDHDSYQAALAGLELWLGKFGLVAFKASLTQSQDETPSYNLYQAPENPNALVVERSKQLFDIKFNDAPDKKIGIVEKVTFGVQRSRLDTSTQNTLTDPSADREIISTVVGPVADKLNYPKSALASVTHFGIVLPDAEDDSK